MVLRLDTGKSRYFSRAFRLSKVRQIDDRQHKRLRIIDNLHRFHTHSREHSAQDLMSPHHLAETLFESRRVEWTIHVNSHGDVVRVTHRLKLIEEPHPLLRK